MDYQLLLLILVGIVDLSSADGDAKQNGCPDNTWYYLYPEGGTERCYKIWQNKLASSECELIHACNDLNTDAIPATLRTVADARAMKQLNKILNWRDGIIIGVQIPCLHYYDSKLFQNVDGTPLAEPLDVINDMDHPENFAMIVDSRTDDVNPDVASWDVDNRVLCALDLHKGPTSPNPFSSDKCPDDSWTYKEFNGIAKCYKMYTPKVNIDRCGLKDACRPLNDAAIPTAINSYEEKDYLRSLVHGRDIMIVGVLIPCPRNFDVTRFENIDGSPFNVSIRLNNGYYNADISQWDLEDANLEREYAYYKVPIMCSIAPQNRKTTQKSMTTQNPFSSDKCPDDSYIYKEFNGVGECYKKYKTPNKIDQCSLINACHSLDPDAIPVTITSIEQRDFLKTLVDPSVYTLIGVSIPCGHPCNAKAYENVDGTPLPAPLEVTADACPKQVLGMLYKNKTNNLDPKDPHFHGDVLCSVPLWCST